MKYTLEKIFFTTISLFFIAIFLHSLAACKKEKFLTEGGDLVFSTDTLKFDTVFTSIGSVTRAFKIFNKNNRRIKISEIKLEVGSASNFRMNIDGEPTKKINNVEIAPNDSLYVFVAVTIDPTSGLLPFLVQDKVVVTLNGKDRNIPLEAFGQDAHYVVDSVLKTQTWVNDKPYVVIHSALVDSNETLTIQKGCRIYMHQDSKLYVKGVLKAFGTKKDSIIFQGDRLDRDYFGYNDYPGEWGGLLFLQSSQSNDLNYCIIKNAGNQTDDRFIPAAISVVPSWDNAGNRVLTMNYCTVSNSSTYGILCFKNRIQVNNTLINTCGLQNVALVEGGDYEFNYCTMVNFGGRGIVHTKQPVFAALNYRDVSLTEYVTAELRVKLRNCLIYGYLDNEVLFDKKDNILYDVTLENCLYKKADVIVSGLVTETNCIRNKEPEFIDQSKWNFRLKTTSIAKGSGKSLPDFPTDLDGNNWLNPSSIGCYEVQ
jgi:hypothetical protein